LGSRGSKNSLKKKIGADYPGVGIKKSLTTPIVVSEIFAIDFVQWNVVPPQK
jgi:hypothetical protein